MSEVTKEDALTHITQVYRYALSLGNSHPFARDLSVWMTRQWSLNGTMAVQAVQREKNARTKTPAQVNTTDPPKLVKFVHPKSQEAQVQEPEPEPVFPSPLQQAVAPSGEGKDTPRRGRKMKAMKNQPTPPEQGGGENPVVADESMSAAERCEPLIFQPPPFTCSAPAEPLTKAELSAVKGMGVREILAEFGEDRLTATLDVLKIEHAELSGSQKAAAVKANAGK